MKCQDCENEAHPDCFLSFDDIGEGRIYWCTECWPRAQAMDRALKEAFKAPGFAAKLEAELNKAEGN